MARTITRQTLAVALSVVGVLLVTTTSLGLPQEPAKGERKEKSNKETPVEPSEILRAAEQLVDGIELEIQTVDWSRVKRLEKPLLLYSDNTRENDRGSVWAWCDRGRPLALLEMFQKLDDRTIWVVGICNTSGRKLRASRLKAPWWLENDSAIEFKDIPSAPPVGVDPTIRQRQLKQLAQKFTAHEIYKPNNTRYDLRRLERPLHTYRDEPGNVVEGGLFTFANGTNPEIMLFIEARTDQKDKSKPVWQYGVGRSSYAELHLEYEGKEVFTTPNAKGLSGPNMPYWASTLKSGISQPPRNAR